MRAIKRVALSVAAIAGFFASVLQLLGIASVWKLFSALADPGKPPFWAYVAIACFAVVLAGLLVIFVVAVVKAANRPRRPFDITDEAFHFKIEGGRVTHVSKFFIKNRAAGDWAFPYRYFWSGSAKPNLKVISPPGASYFEVGREMQWTVGHIVFPVDLTKGQEITIEIQSECEDHDYQCFVSRIPQEKVNSLTLEVTSDRPLQNVAQLMLITPHDGSTKSAIPNDRTNAQPNHHSWRIPNPTVGKQYMLAWK